MYSMKNIVTHDQNIPLPTCMYKVRKLDATLQEDNLQIDYQVTKFYKKSSNRINELNYKQEELLKKIEMLYERITKISSGCDSYKNKSEISKENHSIQEMSSHIQVSVPTEIVLVSNPDMLPWFVNVFLKKLPISFDIYSHSSVPKNQMKTLTEFMKKHKKTVDQVTAINMRLIICRGDAELRLTSQTTPIVGNVNIMRYLTLLFPNIIHYDQNDYIAESLLDLCHFLERSQDQSKAQVWEKLTSHSKNWIYGDNVSIVDLAAYNIIKNCADQQKYVSKEWYKKCNIIFSV